VEAAQAQKHRDPFEPDEGVLLEQMDRKRFHLNRGFKYIDPDWEHHVVRIHPPGNTDLASVPSILWWLVASYGRHTRPALVHDQLVDEIERHDADWIFRKALMDTRIGWVRRWLIFTAVSFETSFRTAFRPRDEAKSTALAAERKQKQQDGTAGTSKQRKKKEVVRLTRPGRLVTVGGFLAVAVHLVVALLLFKVHWIVGGLAVLSWVAFWGAWRSLGWAGLGRLVGFVVGAVIVVPFTVLLLVPLGLIALLELIAFAVSRVLWRPEQERPQPQMPSFGMRPSSGDEPSAAF
jgi:Protein of unknown function (DUF1353)